jgi:hypothetical protein
VKQRQSLCTVTVRIAPLKAETPGLDPSATRQFGPVLVRLDAPLERFASRYFFS